MRTALSVLTVVLACGLSACGGGGKGSSPTASAQPIPVSMSISVLSSSGESLGSLSLTSDTSSTTTLDLAILAGKQIRTSGMHEKFMVVRGPNQNGRVGSFVASTTTGTISWRPTTEMSSLVLWLFPNQRFPFTNVAGKTITYDCAYSNSKIPFGRRLTKRYGVSVGKFKPGTLIWSGPWRGPGYDLGTVNVIGYEGPDYPIIEALTLLNRFLDLGSVKLGSFSFTGSPDSGDMIAGYGYDETKKPGFEGLHDPNGAWFIARNAYGNEKYAPSAWTIMYLEALEAWTVSDDICGENSVGTFVNGYLTTPHATAGWTLEGIDLLRFAALMSPTD